PPERVAPALRLRAQGGGAVLDDRGHAVVARGPAVIRDSRAALRTGRGRPRGQPLRGRPRARVEAASRRISAVVAPAPRSTRDPARPWTRSARHGGRIPTQPGLDRRDTAR